MPDEIDVRKGQVYRCKRRGHAVEVLEVAGRQAFYKNSRGERRNISTERLTDPVRFKLIEERATIPVEIHEPIPAPARDACESVPSCSCENTQKISADEPVSPA